MLRYLLVSHTVYVYQCCLTYGHPDKAIHRSSVDSTCSVAKAGQLSQ